MPTGRGTLTKRQLYWAKALGEVEARWLEEPLRPTDEMRYAELRQASAVPIAAGENAWVMPDEGGVLSDSSLSKMDVDILQPDLSKNCGPARAVALARSPKYKNKRILPHYLGSAVGQALSIPPGRWLPGSTGRVGHQSQSPADGFLSKAGLSFAMGAINIPQEPGAWMVRNDERAFDDVPNFCSMLRSLGDGITWHIEIVDDQVTDIIRLDDKYDALPGDEVLQLVNREQIQIALGISAACRASTRL